MMCFVDHFLHLHNKCVFLIHRRSSLAIHQTNLDYFRMAREFMWLTNSPYNPDDVYGIMDITDYKTVEGNLLVVIDLNLRTQHMNNFYLS